MKKRIVANAVLSPSEGITQFALNKIMDMPEVQVEVDGKPLTGCIVAIDNMREGSEYMFGTIRIDLLPRPNPKEIIYLYVPVMFGRRGSVTVCEGRRRIKKHILR